MPVIDSVVRLRFLIILFMSVTKYSNVNDNTPVLVGCAQLTDKKGINGYNYLEILTEVSKLAIEDCKSSLNLNEHLDTVAVIRFVADTQIGRASCRERV